MNTQSICNAPCAIPSFVRLGGGSFEVCASMLSQNALCVSLLFRTEMLCDWALCVFQWKIKLVSGRRKDAGGSVRIEKLTVCAQSKSRRQRKNCVCILFRCKVFWVPVTVVASHVWRVWCRFLFWIIRISFNLRVLSIHMRCHTDVDVWCVRVCICVCICHYLHVALVRSGDTECMSHASP